MKRKYGRPLGKKSFKNLELIEIEVDGKKVKMYRDKLKE